MIITRYVVISNEKGATRVHDQLDASAAADAVA